MSEKNESALYLAVTLSNLNIFSQFFHCWKAREISNKAHTFHHTLIALLHYLGNCGEKYYLYLFGNFVRFSRFDKVTAD